MSDRPPERWHFILDISHDDAPPCVTARRVLKHLLRAWRIKCVGYSLDKHTLELQEENKQLRQIVMSLEERLNTLPPAGVDRRGE